MKKLFILLVLAFGIVIHFSCNVRKAKKDDTIMKTFHDDDYAAAWKTIDSLNQKGLPQSALESITTLYQQAKSDGNAPQIIKTVIFRGNLMEQLNEDGQVVAINDLRKEIEITALPAKAIMQSMLAQKYANYLNRNQWQLRNRTEITDFKPDDILTWSIANFIDESSDYYLASLSHEGLDKVNIENYKAITTEAKNVDGLRPWLYDFLAHRALEHFMNDRSFLTEPAYAFEINMDEAFEEAEKFAAMRMKVKDAASRKFKAYQLFQKLLTKHLQDEDPKAFIDLDLKRLKFMHDQSTLENKSALYEAALKQLESKYENNEAYAEILGALAQLYMSKTYNGDEESDDKWNFKVAHDYCDKAIAKYPKSYGADQCRNILTRIERKELNTVAEQVIPAEKPILALVNYRNVISLFTKVVKLSDAEKEKLDELNYDKRLPFLNRLAVVQNATYQLPDDGDFRSHSTELKIDPLPFGKYIFMASDTQAFTDQKHAVSVLEFQVSDLYYWARSRSDAKTELVIVDRGEGNPEAGVKAEFFSRNYNSRRRKYEYKVTKTATSNADGNIQVNLPERGYYQVKLTKGEDVLMLDNNLSSYYNNRTSRVRGVVNFFLDRAIYRPGQTVYFKGIAMQKDGKDMPRILKNEEVTVVFKDANYQEVARKVLKTNEYGTINGNFIAPLSGMLGRMQIEATNGKWNNMGNKSLRVEEYKRPKFEVTFQPVTGSFRLNDEVLVKGDAKAFAGSNIDGAKVNYRVVRETIYPYWYGWSWRRFPPQSSSMEITNGETTTDDKGVFEIKFNAIPDASTDPKTKPQFNYRVYVDVVDITGETQSGEQSVSVGYIALAADVAIPNQVNSDSLKSFKISTKNLNGTFEPAQGTVVIELLETPEVVFQNRLWEKPDKPLISRADFQKAFPNFAYQDEDEVHKWPVQREVFRSNFDTEKSKELSFQQGVYKPGQYLLTLKTKDKFGEEVAVKKYFKVYDLDENKAPTNEANWFVQEQNKFEPGEVVKAFQGSAFAKLNVLLSIEKEQRITEQNWNSFSNLKGFQFPVTEKDRGGYHYYINFVKNNRMYSQRQRVHVPWTNKELKIEYQTFRDKLYPGQEEEWRIKISGAKKEKVAAEMVAGMYDASLDQFAANNWSFSAFPSNYYAQRGLNGYGISQSRSWQMSDEWQPTGVNNYRTYRRLNWFNQYGYMRAGMSKRNGKVAMSAPAPEMREESMELEEMVVADAVVVDSDADGVAPSPPPPTAEPEEKAEDLSDVKVRTNLNETVFFFPELRTDADGNILIKFKMNEALTRWKFLGFAHTPDLQFALTEKEIVTQKDLMVQPNPPRFFREGDEIEYTAKVSNLTKVDMNGNAELLLFDALTMKPVNTLLENDDARVSFTVKAGQSTRLAWRLKIPKAEVMAITHRVVAKAGNFSDGEESSLPVLTNRMLVTESKPLAVRGGERKTFVFESLKNAGQSSTLDHHKYTLEFTSNPAWYAVQALPYMMEYPYECTEQIFNRLYANSLATSVANSHPKIKRVFERWKNMDTDALESNLSKNQELKTALLEETPWVLAAQSEAEQKKNIGLLFDLNTMSAQADKAIGQLVERQLGNGGFAWFPGGRDSWYITQYMVEGMGHLSKLGVMSTSNDDRLIQLSNNAVRYIDQRLVEHYKDLKKSVNRNKGKMEDDHLSGMAIHYLYARSFFPDIDQASKQLKEASDYYLAQAKKYWLNKGIYQEGMIALALSRKGDKQVVSEILKSLKERSLNNEELGMYWKFNRGYYWYQAPIETHSLMIELFSEVAKDERAVDDLKVWLLKNKQTTHWKTTKATASAVYALLMNGDNWLLEDADININIAGQALDQSRIQKEAGTGYFKTAWSGKAIESDMSDIVIDNPNKSVSWGAAYWQYFEDLDQIKTFEETPLTLKKQLFKEVNSDTGPKLAALNEGAQLQPGDKLKIRIELRVDRVMEYVHMKDMRASGFEPLNVLSSYKYQGGLGYYESTRDAATNFFFSYLPKGTYVFEYPLRVIHNGDFSNGVTTIQCMYAPEFTSHSEGIRVKVREEI